MAFEKLHSLGDEKFQKILNALMRGESAHGLARVLQEEWGEFQDVAFKTLTQQLNRLRLAAAEGAFGKKVALAIQAGAAPQLKMLEGLSTAAIQRLEELSAMQRQRVMDLIAAEKAAKFQMSAPILVAHNGAITDYAKVLDQLQKMRLDLGLDEFKGVVPGVKGQSVSVTLPDGTNVQKQVFEAVTTLEHIFNERKIPRVTAADL